MDFWEIYQESISNLPHMPEPPGTQAAEPMYASLHGTMCSLLGKEISENHCSTQGNCFSNQPIKFFTNFICSSTLAYMLIVVLVYTQGLCISFHQRTASPTFHPFYLYVFSYTSSLLFCTKNPVFVFCLCLYLPHFQKLEEGILLSRTGVTDSGSVGVGNQSQVF